MSLEKASFLDIGYEKTSFLAFEKSKLRFIQTVPIGSSHITKDISNIFKITYEEAEKIKKSFNESESEFSYENHSDEIKITVNDILKKKISINLLKKIILYRVQEIIDLSFKRLNVHSYNLKLKNSDLFLIGDGSKLFNNNSFYLNDKFGFKSLNFYDEKNLQICKSGLLHYLNNQEFTKRTNKKQGLFESFFNFFSK